MKEKLIAALEQRMNMLKTWTDRDYGGGLVGYYEAYREAKYWKEAIERGEFDEK